MKKMGIWQSGIMNNFLKALEIEKKALEFEAFWYEQVAHNKKVLDKYKKHYEIRKCNIVELEKAINIYYNNVNFMEIKIID